MGLSGKRGTSVCGVAMLLTGLVGAGAALAGPATSLSVGQKVSIDRYVRAEMARQRIPGLELGVYRDGRPVLERGYGLANVEWGAHVTPDTLMQSGSVGKQFAATAVMMLVEAGKVGLDDPITTYFPGAPASWSAIRVKNLLSHTSGLAEYEEGALAKPGGPFDLRLDFTDDELFKKVEALPIEHAPGASWEYRNTNYVLLGFLIRKVTGRFYGDMLHDRIFAPLGMTHTRVISDADIIPGRAAGYEIKGGRLRNQAYVSPTFNRTADGTLYFSVRDLQKWDKALYGDALLSHASLQRMWTPFVLNDGKPNSAGYGFAWAVGDTNGHRVIQHSGAWQGFTSQISRYVDDRFTVVVLTNLDSDHARPNNIEHVVAGLVLPVLVPKTPVPPPDDQPAIAAKARRMLAAAVAGTDLTPEFAPGADYTFLPDDGDEFRAALPVAWTSTPLILLKRSTDGKGVTSSVFRVGPRRNSRTVSLRTDASGRAVSLQVLPDPTAR